MFESLLKYLELNPLGWEGKVSLGGLPSDSFRVMFWQKALASVCLGIHSNNNTLLCLRKTSLFVLKIQSSKIKHTTITHLEERLQG